MSDNLFELKVIAPNRVFFEGKANMLEFTTTEGAMGIYKNHVPTTVILEPCIITRHESGETDEFMVSGGFIEILQDKVTVMAEDVLKAEEIDIERAKAARERAEKILSEHEESMDMKRAEVSLKRSMARLKLTKSI